MERAIGGRPGRIRKLRPEQIADRTTWARVPETDMVKAASHIIRVVPAGSTTITHMFELDPGISGMSPGEGRGWWEPPRPDAPIAVHGRCLR